MFFYFIFSLEILIRDVREGEKILGLKVQNETYKSRFFADRFGLILQHPQNGMEYLMEKLNAALDCFQINKQKTKLLVKNITVQDH